MYLLPQPMKAVWQEGVFCLRYGAAIIIDAAIPVKEFPNIYEYAKLLQAEVKADTGLVLPIRRGTQSVGNILLTTLSTEGLSEGMQSSSHENCMHVTTEQGYELQISADSVMVAAGTETGILYGVQTLRQMLRQAGAVLPCVQVEDAPKIAVRGLSYDTSRGRIPTLEELKRQADVCSFYKMNQLQLYVEHSYLFQGFSEVWRDNTPLEAEEILELDAYCRKLHIDLIPSLASFGHLYEVLRTKTYAPLCELEGADEQAFSLVDRMGHHTLDVSNEDSFAMVAGRIEEFVGLFSTQYFNICGDETFDLCKGRSKELGERLGVKQVYLNFLKKLCNFIVEKGKIPMYWGDVLLEKPELLPEMPQEAICLNWEYWPNVTEEKVKILADAGVQNLYLCPGVQSWNHMINRHSHAYQNISLMCRNAHKYHAQGVLNTEWGDLGHVAPFEFSTIGQIYGAAFSWSDEGMEEEAINRAISVIQYGDSKGEIVSLFRDLADTECVNWWHAVQYKEEQEGTLVRPEEQQMKRILLGATIDIPEVPDAELKARTEDLIHQNEDLLDRLYAKLIEVPERIRPDVCTYLLMGEGQKLLSMTGWALYAFGQHMPVDNAKELAVQWEHWLAEYQASWRLEAKESELHRIVDVICWYADRLREM